MIKRIFSDRNMLLVLALVLGLSIPQFSVYLKEYIMIILAVVMVLSLTAISTSAFRPLKNTVKPMLIGAFLNHIVFGVFIIGSAFLFKSDVALYSGLIIVAATPPGVVIIPFTAKLKGNLSLSILGTFGAFMASIILSPVIINLFCDGANINSRHIIKLMVLLIVVPFIISRFLMINPVKPFVFKHRGKFIDIGFALIIYTSVGINSHVFFDNFSILLQIALIFLIVMIIFGESAKFFLKNRLSEERITSIKLMYSLKSSGFAVVTSMNLFGNEAAVPATIMSVMVLIYLLYLAFKK